MSKKISSVLLVVEAIIAGIAFYFLQPAISLGYFSSVLFIEVFVGIAIILISNYVSEEAPAVVAFIVIGLCVVFDFIFAVAGTSLFHATAKYNQIGEVQEVTFQEMIESIDTSQIPIVDYQTAKIVAEKKLGEEKSLGSQVVLGDGAIQEVNGEIMYVFPLEHSGFFKWNSNRTTPGYITVSASNSTKVNFVKDLKIKYQPSAYFGCDLTRYMRTHGCLSDGLTEYTFEISDDGNPCWVVTTYNNTICWGTPEATSVVIVDAQTGEIAKYSVADTPDWVDVVQPDSFIENQINNYGTLVHGVFNLFLSKKDCMKKTDGVLTVYNNGDCYYFTGMTSVGSDESVMGFMMVNTRTKEAMYAQLAGATETAAMGAAEDLVKNYGFYATEPLPINVNGIPTYAVALKGSSGLIQKYAMINVESYDVGAYGDTLAEAQTAYMKKVNGSSTGYAASDNAYGYDLEGEIFRISSEIQNGETVYYFMISGEEDKLFEASYGISNELSITEKGDEVKIYYVDDGNGSFSVTSFDNVKFSTVVSENQENRNELDEDAGVTSSAVDVNEEKNEDWWDSLSDEEKADIMNQNKTGE